MLTSSGKMANGLKHRKIFNQGKIISFKKSTRLKEKIKFVNRKKKILPQLLFFLFTQTQPMKFKNFYSCIIALAFSCHSLAQVNVQPISNADMTAFLQGSGIVLSNLQVNCDSAAYGAMTTASGNFPMGSGIVLSTGKISDLSQASTGFASTFFSTPGDYDIQYSVTYQTYDACAVEFDAVPSFPNIFFEYVFASEEYPEFVCSFNDAFMLLISGPGINGAYSLGAENIALLPDDSSIVSINTVHDSSTACATPFDSLYIDNSTDTNIVFDGFTQVLTAGISLPAGQNYHFKIVVADVMDGIFDSGVFLMQSSFRSMGLLKSQALENTHQIKVFPNPSSDGNFRIETGLKLNFSTISLFNSMGQNITTDLEINNSGVNINLNDFPSGLYFARLGDSVIRLLKSEN